MKQSLSPILARPEPGGGGRNPQSAFTLIEMLVVIGVVGILSALILPALSGAKAHAYDTTCKSNLHQWQIAWMNYTEENNGYFSAGTSVWWARGEWLAVLQSAYQKKPDLLLCPVATHRRGQGIRESQTSDDNPNAVDWGGPTTAWAAPLPDSASPGRKIISSYGLNLWVYNPPAGVTNIQGRTTSWNWRKFDVPQPAQVPLFLDAMWRGGGPRETDFPPPFNGAWEDYNAEFCHFAIARHGNGVNALFFDGSVRHMRARELWGLQWNRHYDANLAQTNIVFPDWMK